MRDEIRQTIHYRNTIRPDRGPAHTYLADFVGKWQIKGHNGPTSPGAESAAVIGEETYEWYDGEFFLLNRSERQMGDLKFTGLGWIGYDQGSARYLSYSISSLGYLRLYEVEVHRGELQFRGENERATLTLGADKATLFIHWEHSLDGRNWRLLCDMTGHRLSAGTPH